MTRDVIDVQTKHRRIDGYGINILSARCPKCFAEPGQLCLNASGHSTDGPHGVRYDASRVLAGLKQRDHCEFHRLRNMPCYCKRRGWIKV